MSIKTSQPVLDYNRNKVKHGRSENARHNLAKINIAGNEGVGDVVEIGNKVARTVPGDRVILNKKLLGTWCYYGIYNESDLQKISNKVPLVEAATMAVSPCTAFRLISDFGKLRPGDTVIQNAANSAIGQCVIQMCAAFGYKTLNIVTSHCGFESVKIYLKSIGANIVVTLDEAEVLSKFDTYVQRPVLALNCLGGRYEDVLLRFLEANGNIVYYGDSFNLPLVKRCCRTDCNFHKFHFGLWDRSSDTVAKQQMFKKIVELMLIGKLRAPLYSAIELKDFKTALKNTECCEAASVMNYVFDFTHI